MIYDEASYFDGYHFAHIARWQDYHRVQRNLERCSVMAKRANAYARHTD
jgi:hypothetical protein